MTPFMRQSSEPRQSRRRVVPFLFLALLGILWSALQVSVGSILQTAAEYYRNSAKSDDASQMSRIVMVNESNETFSVSILRQGTKDVRQLTTSSLTLNEPVSSFEARPRVVAFSYGDEVIPLAWTPPLQLAPPKATAAAKGNRFKYKPPVCIPEAEWQTKYYPTCNLLHEISLNGPYTSNNDTLLQLLGFGAASDAWRIGASDPIVLKTLRFHRPGAKYDMNKNRVEATIMERLSANPHVVDMYAYCSTSGLYEFADGGDLQAEIEQTTNMTALRKLQIAVQAANGLVTMHSTDHANRSVLVHRDVKADQFIKVRGQYKLNDFNLAAHKTNCSLIRIYPEGQASRYWAPEEYRPNNLTEAIDVYCFGNVLYTLLHGHMPYQHVDREEAVTLMMNGLHASLSQAVSESRDPIIAALRNATNWCRAMDPSQRPTMPLVKSYLQSILEKHAHKD